MLNIPHQTIEHCELIGLEAWSIGGGYDFVGFTDRDSGISFRLTEKGLNQAGELNCPAELCVYDGIATDAVLKLEFSLLSEALDATGTMEFRSLVLKCFSDRLLNDSDSRSKRVRNYCASPEVPDTEGAVTQLMEKYGVTDINYFFNE